MEVSNSYKTKLSRRKRKYSSMLLKETGLKEVPKSKFLMVCNAGLVSGLELGKLVQYFSQFCPLQNVLMIPGKSYCFVQCFNENEAEHAYNEINGKLTLPEANGPLYLLYCESLPQQNPGMNFHYKPSGLLLSNNFITDDEEKLLIDMVHRDFENSRDTLKHRLVKHYGYEFNYKTNNVDKSNQMCEPIPFNINFLLERIKSLNKLNNWVPNQITINCYQPGQGIPFHVDTHSAFDDYILSLSIGSDIIMEFKKKEKRCSVLLERKSLLIMTDECRYAWQHGIVPRKYDVIETSFGLTTQARNERISFTFRRIRNEDCCNCCFVEHCDTRLNAKNHNKSLIINNDLASELEKIHVHKVYDVIADHFSETRHKPWPNVENFIKSFEPGSIFIDVGCGNGKYLGLNTSIYQIGCDRSIKLSQECSKKGFEALICDCLELPFRSGIADFCICIAVIHHLATEERRMQAIKEIVRILKIGGRALIYVWAKNQEQNKKPSCYLMQSKNADKVKESNDVTHSIKLNGCCDNDVDQKCETNNQPINEISLPVHVNRTQFKYEDMLVPWKLKLKGKECVEDVPTFLRFYHVFCKGELETLCEKIPGNKIIETYYDQGNWCAILEKL